ncbi:MAG: 3-isopropylmalate dehydratase small subunit [Chromatiales bacterium]|jgi:3-isopropylmalate/(R)-2-methylmalate dehydratase small subunit|nr:3-isopropylmalate dehydratase small subunit [Chromatiales bacterium]
MDAVNEIRGVAAPLDRANVDTDQMTPARFMGSLGNRAGFGEILFHDLRLDDEGAERPDFVLNQAPFRDANILVADRNFGCGSSRETAVWALYQYGFRAVIAPSFGDIFHSNSAKNGLLVVRLSVQDCDDIRRTLNERPGMELTLDLENQQVTVHDGRNEAMRFDFDPFQKHCLLNGLDDIGITLDHEAMIDDYELKHRESMSWLTR